MICGCSRDELLRQAAAAALLRSSMYIYIYIYICMCIYIYIYIHICTHSLSSLSLFFFSASTFARTGRGPETGAWRSLLPEARSQPASRTNKRVSSLLPEVLRNRGKILHTRNRHLRNQRGFSVAFSNGCPVAFSNIIALFSGISQRMTTFPVDFHWNHPMGCRWHLQMDSICCEIWCVICCPDPRPMRMLPGRTPPAGLTKDFFTIAV